MTHVPTSQVADLFALADVMPHAATFEAFGLAIVEAAATGLPVVTHDEPHFRWLIPNPDCWIDMEAPGILSALLTRMAADPDERTRRVMRDHARATYDWAALRPAYADLYRSMMS